MKKAIVIVVVICLLVGAGFGGRKLYHTWRTDRALKNAKSALAKAEYNSAVLWLRQTLKSQGNNLEAIQLMGDFAEASRSPSALAWRKRLVEVSPTFTNKLVLAHAALDFKDYELTRKTLLSVEGNERKSPEFLKIAGALALSTGRSSDAIQSYRDALKVQPDDPQLQVSLAMLLAQSPNPADSAAGLASLERLRSNPAVQNEALRNLVFDGFRKTNYARAISLANQLVSLTNATTQDRILHLGLLASTSNSELKGTLMGYQRAAGTNLKEVFELSRWMLSIRGVDETHEWLKTMAPKVTTNLPVTIIFADTLLGQHKWPALQQHVSSQNWGDLNHLRHSYLSRALKEQNFQVAANAEWGKAFKAAEGLLDRLQSLVQVTRGWGWEVEYEEVLSKIVNLYPNEQASKESLVEHLAARGNTRSLLALFAAEVRRDPKNMNAKNNLASLALLLGTMEHRPHELAEEVYRAHPENPSYASTYAFSLYQQKKLKEALAVFEKMPTQMLDLPGVAGYYGLCLAATGPEGKAKAAKYLDVSTRARMLPEEVQLFQRARQ